MLRESIAKFFKVDSLISNLTGYVETRIELMKLEAKEELAKGLSRVLVFFLLAFVFALVIVFTTVGVALLIAERLGGFAAFCIVGGFYAVVGVVMILARESLTAAVEKRMRNMMNKKND